MGLLESLAGQVLNSLGGSSGTNAGQSGMLEVLGELLHSQNGGGLKGLASAFEQNGLGEIISSWIGKGQNLPISAEQLQSVLGSDKIQAMAEKLGFSPQDVLSHLTDLMPKAVDHLTPEGSIPEHHETADLGSLLDIFKKS